MALDPLQALAAAEPPRPPEVVEAARKTVVGGAQAAPIGLGVVLVAVAAAVASGPGHTILRVAALAGLVLLAVPSVLAVLVKVRRAVARVETIARRGVRCAGVVEPTLLETRAVRFVPPDGLPRYARLDPTVGPLADGAEVALLFDLDTPGRALLIDPATGLRLAPVTDAPHRPTTD